MESCGSDEVCDFNDVSCVDAACSNVCLTDLLSCSVDGDVLRRSCDHSGDCSVWGGVEVDEVCGFGCSAGACDADPGCSDARTDDQICGVEARVCEYASDSCDVDRFCGYCDSGASCDGGSCVVDVANLVATITETTTVETMHSSGCLYNKCNFDISVVNSGTASGFIGSRVDTESGIVSYTENYNKEINPGIPFNIVGKFVRSGCTGEPSYTYTVKIFDDGGDMIGSKSITCSYP
jgi:hypothetical protein